jgi:hypothetical protein
MAHFAELDNDKKVLRVVVIDNTDVTNNGGDQSTAAENFVKTIVPFSENGKSWKQTSYNGNFRKQFAVVNGTYDADKNKFILQTPEGDGWTVNSDGDWVAPDGYPSKLTYTHESVTLSWDVRWNASTSGWTGIQRKIDESKIWTWNNSSEDWEE